MNRAQMVLASMAHAASLANSAARGRTRKLFAAARAAFIR